MRKFLLGATALFCGLVGHAQANLILKAGPGGGNAGTDNVIFNACDTSSSTRTTRSGLSQYGPCNAREFHGDRKSGDLGRWTGTDRSSGLVLSTPSPSPLTIRCSGSPR